VLDFGCGFGIEALQYARAGNQVMVADINPETITVAERVLGAFGYQSTQVLVDGSKFDCPPFDIFHSAGVLHHIPNPRPILERAVKLLKPGGEIRLMLYGDKTWYHVSKQLPPVDADIREHPLYQRFVRSLDGVGYHADWYSRAKVEHLWGDFLDIKLFEPLCDRGYIVTVLTPKEGNV
jgi:SAM-dependent methyltransferase